MSDSEGDEDVFAAMCEESEQALDLFRDNDDHETQTPDQEDMFAEMCADVEIGASPESPPPAESAWAASPAQSPQKSARDGSIAQHCNTDSNNVSPDAISAHALAPELDDRAREKDIAAQPKRMETKKEQNRQEAHEESCQPSSLPAKAKIEGQNLGPAPPPPVFAQHCSEAPSVASQEVKKAKMSSGAGSTLECKSDSGKVADEVASTRKAHPFTLQAPKVKLAPLRRSSVAAASKAKRLQKLHSELQDLSQRRQYQDAAKVFRRMKDLGGELSQARMSEADAKHNVVVKTLDTQEKDCLNALKRKWGARFEAFEKETQVQVDAQRKADAKERRELREETFESFREKPLLFSATIMDLRQRELSLVKAQDYPQAKVLQEKIERLASEERQRALDTCLRNIEAAVGNLEAKQARTLRILQDRRNLQLERLKAKARSEEQAVWTRFQTAHRSVGLAHSLSRQTLARAKPERLHKNAVSAGAVMGMYKSSAAERKYEATLASITSLTARLHADEVRGFNGEQTAPDTTENVRARTAPSGCVTGRRRRARTAGRKNDRKPGACHMCKRSLAHSDAYVAIPRDYNRPMTEGIGQFCGWACAKSWNQSKSPPQLRWARELYMRTAEKSHPIARTSSARERPSLTISTLSN